MPTSIRQIESNRHNAQKSTGPKSMEGKEMSSHNAVKHGLYSRELIIRSLNLTEDPEEFERLHESLVYELMPNTQFQEYLVFTIAICIWRSRRAFRAEAADIIDQVDDVDDEYRFRKDYPLVTHKPNGAEIRQDRTPEDVQRIRALEIDRQMIPDPDQDSSVIRYQMRIDRQMARAYSLLDRLQRRQGRDIAGQRDHIEVPVPIYRCPVPQGGQCRRESDAANAAASTEAAKIAEESAADTPPGAPLRHRRTVENDAVSSPLPRGEGSGVRDMTGSRIKNDPHAQKRVRIEPGSAQPHDVHAGTGKISAVMEVNE